MTAMLKLSTGLLTALVISTLAGPVLAFNCQDKGSLNYGVCKNLGRGMCSFTAGDGTRVKLRCKDLRRT